MCVASDNREVCSVKTTAVAEVGRCGVTQIDSHSLISLLDPVLMIIDLGITVFLPGLYGRCIFSCD